MTRSSRASTTCACRWPACWRASPPRSGRAWRPSRSTWSCGAASTRTASCPWHASRASAATRCASSSTWTSGHTNGWDLGRGRVGRGDPGPRRLPSCPSSRCRPTYPGEVASRWRYRDGGGEIGVIASVTQPFCAHLHARPAHGRGRPLHLPLRRCGHRPAGAAARRRRRRRPAPALAGRAWGGAHGPLLRAALGGHDGVCPRSRCRASGAEGAARAGAPAGMLARARCGRRDGRRATAATGAGRPSMTQSGDAAGAAGARPGALWEAAPGAPRRPPPTAGESTPADDRLPLPVPRRRAGRLARRRLDAVADLDGAAARTGRPHAGRPAQPHHRPRPRPASLLAVVGIAPGHRRRWSLRRPGERRRHGGRLARDRRWRPQRGRLPRRRHRGSWPSASPTSRTGWVVLRGTPGMRMLGLRIGDQGDGHAISWDQALRALAPARASPATLVTFVVYVPSLVGLVLRPRSGSPGWSCCCSVEHGAESRRKQGLHDRRARTIVVRSARAPADSPAAS